MKKNRLILTAAVAVSVMALAACGSSNKTPEATTAAAAEATDASASDTATASQLSADDPEIQALEATEVPELPKFSDMGTVKLCDLTGITVETSPKLTVDEDMVNSQIDYLRKNYLTETEDAAKEGDTVNIDFVGKMDGEAFDGGSGTSYDLVLGSGSFIDGFEDQLIGAKKGEKLEVNVTFPESYPNNPDLAGKPAVFDVTVNKVSTMPELTDQWVKEHAADMGSKASDVASFRVEQQALLQAQVDYQYNNTIQQDALQQIVDASEFTVSDAMQKYAEDYVISQEVSTAKQYGHGLADMLNMYGMSVDDFKEEINHGKQNDKSDEGDHWSEDPLELCKCVGAEEHQRRHGEILRVSADPERGYGDGREDQEGNRSRLQGRRGKAEGQWQERTSAGCSEDTAA